MSPPPSQSAPSPSTLKAPVKRVLHAARSAWLSFPPRIECNLCGWKGRAFVSDGWHDNSVCPHCDAQLRHRLLFAILQHEVGGYSLRSVFQGKRILHFAPEPPISRRLRPIAATYATADLFMPGCDLRLDIADMSNVPGAAYDVVIACDVLEHIADDRKALREIHRVLSPRGLAVLMVPQKDGLEETFEDPSITTDEQRLRAYGIFNHHRIYGTDFTARLAAAGFAAHVFDHQHLSPAVVERQILFPRAPSPHPLATNYRRVYFAQKQ